MSCTNCFNGCAETVSDQCVKYTGIDVPALGIQHGDTLATVENAIISFIEPFIDGSGIKPVIDPDIICTLVKQYLPTCTECNGFNLNDVLSAIIKATCDLQEEIDSIVAELAIINSPYDSDCLSLSPTANTHTVVQAIIDKLCQLDGNFTTLINNLPNTYVPINSSPGNPGINDYIEAYLASLPSDLVNAKMVPFVAYEYYGTLSGKFDGTGAGIGLWQDIYLCNGNNGTPDKRGRVAVCAIDGMGGGLLDPAVNPLASAANPNYSLNDSIYGANSVTLNTSQIPNHNHGLVVNFTDPGHRHVFGGDDQIGTLGGYTSLSPFSYDANSTMSGGGKNYYTKNTDGTQNLQSTGITISATNQPTGGGLSHNNIQPVYACYYIIYIPS